MQNRSYQERPKAHGLLRVEDPYDVYSCEGPIEGMFLHLYLLTYVLQFKNYHFAIYKFCFFYFAKQMFILIDEFANEEENSVVHRSPLLDEVDADRLLFSQISENEVAIDRFAGYAVVDRNPQPM